MKPCFRGFCSGVWAVILLGSGGFVPAATNSPYWSAADSIHRYIISNFKTAYGSYRIQTNSDTAFEWYSASQIYADSAMVAGGDTNYLAGVIEGQRGMNHFWDGTKTNGGYFAAMKIDGSGAGGDKYTDDNALAGNVSLDCYARCPDRLKRRFLDSAKAAATWLITSGQWDDTFGGGFWWSEQKQNKPTQSNGLALQLFLRLYQITGQKVYRDWAQATQAWLDHRMFKPADGLYVWQITTNGTPEGVRSDVEFTYDNAIMIEAELLYKEVFPASGRPDGARNLAVSLDRKLWNDEYGVYAFNTADGRVNPCWCGWASQSLIKLYAAEGGTNWLEHARRNVDYMNAHLRDGQEGGYFAFCHLDGSNVEKRMEGVDQAWMQKLQAMLARYY